MFVISFNSLLLVQHSKVSINLIYVTAIEYSYNNLHNYSADYATIIVIFKTGIHKH